MSKKELTWSEYFTIILSEERAKISNKKLKTNANCWEKDDRCNDCPIDYPQKQCSEYHIFKL